MGWLASEAWKAWAVPWKLARMEAGSPIPRSTPSMAFTASPSATSGARLNDRVTDGSCPWWLTCSGVMPGVMCVKALRGTWAPVGERT